MIWQYKYLEPQNQQQAKLYIVQRILWFWPKKKIILVHRSELVSLAQRLSEYSWAKKYYVFVPSIRRVTPVRLTAKDGASLTKVLVNWHVDDRIQGQLMQHPEALLLLLLRDEKQWPYIINECKKALDYQRLETYAFERIRILKKPNEERTEQDILLLAQIAQMAATDTFFGLLIGGIDRLMADSGNE